MPKGNAPRGKGLGGRRRTIICPCGYRIIGDPTRQGMIERLHKKKCEVCQGASSVSNQPFDPTHANKVDFSNTGNYHHTDARIHALTPEGKSVQYDVGGVPGGDVKTCDARILSEAVNQALGREGDAQDGVEVKPTKKKKKKKKKRSTQ